MFKDRIDAGRQLAVALSRFRGDDPIVLGLVRGGIVLAAEIANELGCQLDVLVARKVGAPNHPEHGIGAVAPGVTVCDEQALQRLFISPSHFRELAEREQAEVARRIELYRGDRLLDLSGRTAILVDDGLATGVTAKAACRYARSLGPSKLVLAAPVCTAQARKSLEPEVDQFVCLAQPEPFYAVGQWYGDFAQIKDEEVLGILENQRGCLT